MLNPLEKFRLHNPPLLVTISSETDDKKRHDASQQSEPEGEQVCEGFRHSRRNANVPVSIEKAASTVSSIVGVESQRRGGGDLWVFDGDAFRSVAIEGRDPLCVV